MIGGLRTRLVQQERNAELTSLQRRAPATAFSIELSVITWPVTAFVDGMIQASRSALGSQRYTAETISRHASRRRRPAVSVFARQLVLQRSY